MTTHPHAELLNCLVAMQETLLYAARKVTLQEAERVIVSQAAKVDALTAERDQWEVDYNEARLDRERLIRERDAALKLAADRLVDAERYRLIKAKGWMELELEATIDAAMQAAKESPCR